MKRTLVTIDPSIHWAPSGASIQGGQPVPVIMTVTVNLTLQ
jgi:hypothetical protein